MTRDALLRFVRLVVKGARKRMRTYARKFAPKRSIQPALLASWGLNESLKLDYRGIEGLGGRRLGTPRSPGVEDRAGSFPLLVVQPLQGAAPPAGSGADQDRAAGSGRPG